MRTWRSTLCLRIVPSFYYSTTADARSSSCIEDRTSVLSSVERMEVSLSSRSRPAWLAAGAFLFQRKSGVPFPLSLWSSAAATLICRRAAARYTRLVQMGGCDDCQRATSVLPSHSQSAAGVLAEQLNGIQTRPELGTR